MTRLVINRTDSYCAGCGKGADPDEWRHESVLGYYAADAVKPDACMAMFTEVSSDYAGMRELIQARRPDLQWVGFES